MQIDEKTYNRLPKHLQTLFGKAPNPEKEEVMAAFPVTETHAGTYRSDTEHRREGWGTLQNVISGKEVSQGNNGSAARFFFTAKASKGERERGLESMEKQETGAMQGNLVSGQRLAGIATPKRANTHPTCKPVKLMEWLVKLVCPPGGLVLDPFSGSGTTLKACILTGRKGVGVEQEEPYCEITAKRLEKAVITKQQLDSIYPNGKPGK